jgi:hypothetical protein
MTSAGRIQVVKASGETEPFDSSRLRTSLQRSGADDELINKITEQVERQLRDGITTKEIYRIAFALLAQRASHKAARYKLKAAIYELGPSGFPFERFVGELLKHQGYKVQVGVIVQGKCVSHEVDVEAQKDHEHFMVECKFHSDQARKCDVKIPLYVHSRFQDISAQWSKESGHGQRFHQGWLVTNTRFTTDAVQYGNCAGLHLISWDHPKSGSLRQRIDVSGLYPITCLATLNNREKQALLNAGIVLAKDLADQDLMQRTGLRKQKFDAVMGEVKQLIGSL